MRVPGKDTSIPEPMENAPLIAGAHEKKEDCIMKKLFALLLTLAMVLSLAACGGDTADTSEDTADDTQTEDTGDTADTSFTTVEEGKLIMSTNAQFPPYEMVADGEGVYQGFEGIDIEIAVAIAEKLGLELQIDDMEFDSALLAVQNNAADVMLAGLSYREDRDEVVDFYRLLCYRHPGGHRQGGLRRDHGQLGRLHDRHPARHYRLSLCLRHPGERRLR